MLSEQHTSTEPCKHTNQSKKSQNATHWFSNIGGETKQRGLPTQRRVEQLWVCRRGQTERVFGGGVGGQVTSPWALKSPVSLKLGWDSEAHEKIRQGGGGRGGGRKKKKKRCGLCTTRNQFNINLKKENMWRINKEESDTDVKQQPEPPPPKTQRNTKRWKIFNFQWRITREEEIKTDGCSDGDLKLKPKL